MTTTIHNADQCKVGAFGLARIEGTVGKLIYDGQVLAGDRSKWTHAFIINSRNTLVEAQWPRAVQHDLSEYLDGKREVIFCDQPIQDWLKENPGVYGSSTEPLKRFQVAQVASSLINTKYGLLQYPAIGLHSKGIDWPLLRNFIANNKHMICSQLVDETYKRSNIACFTDNRWPQEVTPADLAWRYGL